MFGYSPLFLLMHEGFYFVSNLSACFLLDFDSLSSHLNK